MVPVTGFMKPWSKTCPHAFGELLSLIPVGWGCHRPPRPEAPGVSPPSRAVTVPRLEAALSLGGRQGSIRALCASGRQAPALYRWGN